ncbi:MAG TPA: ATP-dependent DNA ligase [Naasia sp.]
MGSFFYDRRRTDFDDRTLAHLRHVIVAKLRRGESFELTWNLPVEAGSGRVSVWLHPSVPLKFTFSSGVRHQLNRAWIEALAANSFSTTGLHLLPEPAPQSD